MTTVPLASTTTLAPGVLSEDLTFAGPFNGHLTTAKVADAGDVVDPREGIPTGIGACNTTFPVDPAYPNSAVIGIEGELNGKRLLVEVQRDAFTSPQHTKSAGYVRWGDEEYSFLPDLAELDSDLLGATIHSPLATKTPHDWTESQIRGHIRCVPWAAPAAVPDVIVGPPDTEGEDGFVAFAQQVRDSLSAGDDSLIFGRFDSLPHTCTPYDANPTGYARRARCRVGDQLDEIYDSWGESHWFPFAGYADKFRIGIRQQFASVVPAAADASGTGELRVSGYRSMPPDANAGDFELVLTGIVSWRFDLEQSRPYTDLNVRPPRVDIGIYYRWRDNHWRVVGTSVTSSTPGASAPINQLR